MVAPVFISGRTNHRALKTLPLFSNCNHLNSSIPFYCVFQVRMTTANKVYETLLVNDEVCEEEKYDEILSLLSETKW